MDASCMIEPKDKKALGKRVGADLCKRYGQQRYYTVRQVQSSLQRTDSRLDWDCWAFALYTSPSDFDSYHASTGEICDYAALKAEMVAALTDGAAASRFNDDLSWLELRDFDFSMVLGRADKAPARRMTDSA